MVEFSEKLAEVPGNDPTELQRYFDYDECYLLYNINMWEDQESVSYLKKGQFEWPNGENDDLWDNNEVNANFIAQDDINTHLGRDNEDSLNWVYNAVWKFQTPFFTIPDHDSTFQELSIVTQS